MNKLDLLEQKVRQVSEELVKLKEERNQLLAERKFYETEQQKTRDLIREVDRLREDRKFVTGRVEKLVKRISALNV